MESANDQRQPNNLANNGKRRTTEKTNPPTSDDEPKNNNGKAHRALTNQVTPASLRRPFLLDEADELRLLADGRWRLQPRAGGTENNLRGRCAPVA